MQTFLPSLSFQESAQCLDRQRLGKQRVEVLQILNALLGKSTAWRNHPNVKMWRGYERALHSYGVEICVEWIRRGYKDTCLEKLGAIYQAELKDKEYKTPEWLNEEFCREHRKLLLEKDFAFYSKKFDANGR